MFLHCKKTQVILIKNNTLKYTLQLQLLYLVPIIYHIVYPISLPFKLLYGSLKSIINYPREIGQQTLCLLKSGLFMCYMIKLK